MAFILIALYGCEKDWLDINTDPNNPSEAQLSLLLPTVEVMTAEAVGMSTGGLSNVTSTFVHQLEQRGNLNDYNLTGDEFGVSNPWNDLYLGPLTDIRELIDQGSAQESWHYVGVGQILKAYIFSVLVDLWGDVPYQQANQGIGNLGPAYQNGEVVYDSIFVLLDEGITNLERENSTTSPGGEDVIYGGDLSLWIKFANTLKLKLYNQIRLVENVSGPVNALLTEGNLLSEIDDDFELDYGSSAAPDNRNPGYVQEWSPGGSFYYIDPFFYEVMRGEDSFGHGNDIFFDIRDPRIPYYFYNQLLPNEDPENASSYWNEDTGFLSIYSFSFDIDPNEGFDQGSSQTVAGLYPVGGRFDVGDGVAADFNGYGQTSQRMLTYFSRLYIEAELAIAGVTTGDDAALTQAAIEASFAKVNEVAADAGAPAIEAAVISGYVNDVMALYNEGSQAEKLEILMTQKWIASFGYGVDSYTDYRRTNYPQLHNGNEDILAVTIQSRGYVVSFPYLTTELQLNPSLSSQKNVYSNFVFWDR